MPRSATALLLATFALGGCDAATTRATLEGLTWDNISTDAAFATEAAAFEVPFTRGVIAIVAAEGGELRTYRLYPCSAASAVCLNSPQGPAAAVQRGRRHYIVAIPGGRTFFLRPGGGGTLRTAQGDGPLAWNAYINGTPAWPGPAFPALPGTEPTVAATGP
jgi:hypothetical protein